MVAGDGGEVAGEVRWAPKLSLAATIIHVRAIVDAKIAEGCPRFVRCADIRIDASRGPPGSIRIRASAQRG